MTGLFDARDRGDGMTRRHAPVRSRVIPHARRTRVIAHVGRARWTCHTCHVVRLTCHRTCHRPVTRPVTCHVKHKICVGRNVRRTHHVHASTCDPVPPVARPRTTTG